MYFSARNKTALRCFSQNNGFEMNVFYISKILECLPRISNNCEDLIGISDVLSHRNPLSLV